MHDDVANQEGRPQNSELRVINNRGTLDDVLEGAIKDDQTQQHWV